MSQSNGRKKVTFKKSGTKKSTAKKPAEVMFMGNSEELKQFINKKKNALISLNAETSDEELENRLCGMIYVCECVLDLSYFKRGKIKTMSELIELIKEDRAELKQCMEELQPDLEAAQKEAEEAFKAAGSYLANKFEDEYNSPSQERARECVDEFQILKYQYDKASEESKTKWWLLGIIHRPVGFFEKANVEG